MAYINLAENPAFGAATARMRDPQGRDGRLSPLEWSVVALSARDSLATIERPGRIAKALATLFGTTPNNILADPRLEALRRLSVLAWHYGSRVGTASAKQFLRAGFSKPQLRNVIVSIEHYRAAGANAAKRRA